MSSVETLLAEVACRADDSMHHHERTDDFPCAACRSLAAEQAESLPAWLTSEGPFVLAEEGFRHSWDTSDERLIDGTWVAGLCCECGAFVPYGQEVAHVATALAPLLADLIGGSP